MRTKDSYENAKIHVKRDGTILADGDPVGLVQRIEGGAGARIADWRAEVGDAREPDSYRVVYAGTRKRAVRGVLTGD